MEENTLLIAHAKELCRACGMPLHEAIEAIKRISKPHVFIGADTAAGKDFVSVMIAEYEPSGLWSKIVFDTRVYGHGAPPKPNTMNGWYNYLRGQIFWQMTLPNDPELLAQLKRRIYQSARPVSVGYSVGDLASELQKVAKQADEPKKNQKNALGFLDGLYKRRY
jgi:hypothetical protein